MLLSSREKWLLALLAVLLAVTAAFFTVRGLVSYQHTLERQVASRRALLTRVQTLEQTLQRLQGSTGQQSGAPPTIARLERVAAGLGLTERLQLNPVPAPQASTVEVVEVKLDDLTLDEAVQFLYAVENAEPVLAVEQMELNPAFRSRELLRLSLRVAGQR